MRCFWLSKPRGKVTDTLVLMVLQLSTTNLIKFGNIAINPRIEVTSLITIPLLDCTLVISTTILIIRTTITVLTTNTLQALTVPLIVLQSTLLPSTSIHLCQVQLEDCLVTLALRYTLFLTGLSSRNTSLLLNVLSAVSASPMSNAMELLSYSS